MLYNSQCVFIIVFLKEHLHPSDPHRKVVFNHFIVDGCCLVENLVALSKLAQGLINL